MAQQQRNWEDTMDLKALEYRDTIEKYLKLETDVVRIDKVHCCV